MQVNPEIIGLGNLTGRVTASLLIQNSTHKIFPDDK
jgi:hypothetical protein